MHTIPYIHEGRLLRLHGCICTCSSPCPRST
jgi:hypothetical protein